jgi:hypothetical protein
LIDLSPALSSQVRRLPSIVLLCFDATVFGLMTYQRSAWLARRAEYIRLCQRCGSGHPLYHRHRLDCNQYRNTHKPPCRTTPCLPSYRRVPVLTHGTEGRDRPTSRSVSGINQFQNEDRDEEGDNNNNARGWPGRAGTRPCNLPGGAAVAVRGW